jgi:hypothetical protein
MNFASLSAIDKRITIAGAAVAIIGVVSFLDPSGSWGPVMVLAILGGLLGAFVALQPQVAPAMKLPMSRGMTLLAAGVGAAGGYAIGMLTYIGYISRNLTDPFVILMVVGLIAGIVLLLTGWQAYQAEPKAAAAPAAPAPAAPGAPAAPAAAPPPPPPAEPPTGA